MDKNFCKNTKILTKIFLILIMVVAFASEGLCIENRSAEEYSAKQILRTYGEDDLSSKPPFQGGYINFGYWKEIKLSQNQVISKQDRIKASFALYKLIIDHLNIKKNDNILEVGCGLGYGCSYVASQYDSVNLTCIDITPEQIKRAKFIHKEAIMKSSLRFEVASADNIDQPSNSYDKIYSVEVAQYFPSMIKFSNEAFRLLKPNGLIVITAHFSVDGKGYDAAKKLLPTVSADIDRIIPISEVIEAFKASGFKKIKIEPIGQYVFEGFDKWISQVNDKPWAHNIYQLYLKGHINYYVLVFKKI